MGCLTFEMSLVCKIGPVSQLCGCLTHMYHCTPPSGRITQLHWQILLLFSLDLGIKLQAGSHLKRSQSLIATPIWNTVPKFKIVFKKEVSTPCGYEPNRHEPNWLNCACVDWIMKRLCSLLVFIKPADSRQHAIVTEHNLCQQVSEKNQPEKQAILLKSDFCQLFWVRVGGEGRGEREWHFRGIGGGNLSPTQEFRIQSNYLEKKLKYRCELLVKEKGGIAKWEKWGNNLAVMLSTR